MEIFARSEASSANDRDPDGGHIAIFGVNGEISLEWNGFWVFFFCKFYHLTELSLNTNKVMKYLYEKWVILVTNETSTLFLTKRLERPNEGEQSLCIEPYLKKNKHDRKRVQEENSSNYGHYRACTSQKACNSCGNKSVFN